MKMSEEFDLPISTNDRICSPRGRRAAVHAINHHDALVSVCKRLGQCDLSELDESLRSDLLYLLGNIENAAS